MKKWEEIEALAAEAPSGDAILTECMEIAATLIEKNVRYGDSALNPVRIFSDAPADAQIRVRIDDKLSRIRNATDGDPEDAILDLIGYLVLLRLHGKR